MTVLLLLFLCADTTRKDCQVLPAQLWEGPGAFEQCIRVVPGLTKALTAPNRQRHRFVCEIQADSEHPTVHTTQPMLIHQSFRM